MAAVVRLILVMHLLNTLRYNTPNHGPIPEDPSLGRSLQRRDPSACGRCTCGLVTW